MLRKKNEESRKKILIQKKKEDQIWVTTLKKCWVKNKIKTFWENK